MLFPLSIENVEKVFTEIEPGLMKYKSLMKMFERVDVSTDTDFKRLYNHFYRMRQRPAEFYREYFNYLQACKGKNIEFRDVIDHLFSKVRRIEPSFSSKLLATVRPEKPVWDKFVLQNLGFKAPGYSGSSIHEKIRRIDECVSVYKEIERWYQSFLQTKNARELINRFDSFYPNAGISDVKKIDLILWQLRD